MDLRGVEVITERYEDGKRIISVETAEEFGQVLHEMDNYRVEIEAPEEVIEAFGIFDSAEELGIEPDDEGLPPEAYERGRWRASPRGAGDVSSSFTDTSVPVHLRSPNAPKYHT